MGTDEIYDTLSSYIVDAAFVACIALAVSFLLYRFIYKRLLKGQRRFPVKKALCGTVFFTYFIVVLCITFFSRTADFGSTPIFQTFSSYRMAWNSFSVRNWQFVIFNVLMFVPFGILLPFLHEKFRRPHYTIGLGILFTVSIETTQLITGYGIFDTGDMFNNTLGAIIGYCVFTLFYTMLSGKTLSKNLRRRRLLLSFLPILCIIGGFAGIFTVYDLKEFGNLKSAYVYRVDCKDTEFVMKVHLSEERHREMIYHIKGKSEEEAQEFSRFFLTKLGAQKPLKTFQKGAIIYQWKQDKEQSVLKYKTGNGTYSYFRNGGAKEKHLNVNTSYSEAEVVNRLESLGVLLPSSYEFKIWEDCYYFIVDHLAQRDDLFDGTISCMFDKEGNLLELDNGLCEFSRYGERTVISEKEAFEKVKTGKFRYYADEQHKTKNMVVKDVKLHYQLDTKGYYRPVYVFAVEIDGTATKISVSALA